MDQARSIYKKFVKEAESTVPWKEAAEDAANQAAAEYRIDRTRQARWDAEHIRSASTRLRTQELMELREECAKQGITVYGLLRYMIDAYMRARWRW